jgi:hypothetical protein
VGVIVSSLTLAGILAVSALVLGSVAGLAFIRFRRRHEGESACVQLDLGPSSS